MSKVERENPFKNGHKFLVFYRNTYHKAWHGFDFLETINECKQVLKKSSYFKVFKLKDDGKYYTLTTKKRINDKIVSELSKKIVSSPYRELIKNNIRDWRIKMEIQLALEKKNVV